MWNPLLNHPVQSRSIRTLTPRDWDALGRFGFSIYVCDLASIKMRQLYYEQELPDSVMRPPTPGLSPSEDFQANAATSSATQPRGADPWQIIPLPSVADVDEQQVLDPKTLRGCCRCAKAFSYQHKFPVGHGRVGVTQESPRVKCYDSRGVS